MSNYNPAITEYIQNTSDFAKPILTYLRDLIHKTCPDIEEKLSWSRPHYYYKGKGMIVTDSLKERVTFGFWHDNLIYESPKLSKSAKDIYNKLGFLKSMQDIPDENLLVETIQLAMEIIDNGREVPKTTKVKKELVVPDYLIKQLDKHKKAKEVFDNFSVSHKREYVEWIDSAKTEETRSKRIEQTIEWLTEGKSRHWKYQK